MESHDNMLQYTIALVLIHLDSILGNSDIKSLGCWIRESPSDIPAISSLEASNEHLSDNFWERRDPIRSCAKAAASLGYNVFAISNRGSNLGGECFSSCSAAKDFAQHGRRSARCAGGTGGYKSMDVYSLDLTVYLGCVKNSLTGYAIPDLEATHPALFGQPHDREHSIEICAAVARSRGYTVFGITKGGRCLGSGDAYTRYISLSTAGGSGKDCSDGKGSDMTISVHLISGIVEFDNSSRKREKHQQQRQNGRRKNRRT